MTKGLKPYASRLLSALGLRDVLKGCLLDIQEVFPFVPFKLDDSFDVNLQLYRIMNHSQQVLKELNEVPSSSSKILFADMRGGHDILGLETFLAHRLRFEGTRPVFVVCEDLPHCNNRQIGASLDYPGRCANCLKSSLDFVTRMRLPIHSLSEFVSLDIRQKAFELTKNLSFEECVQFEYRGVPIGELCEVSVARYLCRDALEAGEEEIETWRDFLSGAIVLVHGYERAFDEIEPDILVVNSGRFFWFSIAHHMALQRGLRTVSYEGDGGKGQHWFFRKMIPASSLELGDVWLEWKDVPLTHSEERQLDDYLAFRAKGTMIGGIQGDEIFSDARENGRAILHELDVTEDRPILVMFTNLTWDSQVVGRRTIFNSMLEWVRETIRFVFDKDLTLVLRVHPAELILHEGDRTRERALENLAEHGIAIPDNVRIIPPDSQMSSYALLELADAALVYTSTIGLEAAIRGTCPVIVAGLAHYWKKGFGYCPDTRDEYFRLLDSVAELSAPSDEEVALARRYAYLFWFRSMIPLQLFETSEQFRISRFTVHSLEDVRPGKNPYLDFVADMILRDGPFVLSRELLRQG